MKKIDQITKNWEVRLKQHCDKLEPKERKRLIWIGVIVYLLLTVASMVWTVVDGRAEKISLKHIQNKNIPAIIKNNSNGK